MRASTRRSGRSAQHGFSLIELMVAMAVLAVVTTFLTDLLVRQSRAYQVVDNVTETQQNLRAIGDLLEHELRVTGFLVSEGAAFCGVDVPPGQAYPDQTPDVIVVTDAEALDPTGVTNQTLGAQITGGYAGTGSNETITVDNVVLDGNAFYDTDGDGVADSDFLYGEPPQPVRNGGVIVVDRANTNRGTSCGILVDLNGNSLDVDFQLGGSAPGGTPLAALPPGGSPPDLVAIPAHVYWIQAGNLVRDGMILAQDVEDLQFAVFYDVDDDDVVDGATTVDPPYASALEYPGSRDVPNGEPGQAYVWNAWDNRDLREIRVNLVGITKSQDPDVVQSPNMAQGQFQVTENRVAPGGLDGFRRRVLTLTVRPRNVGHRQPGS
jgi:prepilin-type N-terminal cleavage/methylation domain-containing protein